MHHTHPPIYLHPPHTASLSTWCTQWLPTASTIYHQAHHHTNATQESTRIAVVRHVAAHIQHARSEHEVMQGITRALWGATAIDARCVSTVWMYGLWVSLWLHLALGTYT